MKFAQKSTGKCRFFILKLPESYPPSLCAASTKSCGDLASFARLLELDKNDLIQAEQIHGNKIGVVTKHDRGRTIPGCDGLITKDVNTPLAIRTADCCPIFILDKTTPAIGLIHAGWRGSIKRIARYALRLMHDSFDTDVKNCIIAMGPAIGACCYEVDERVLAPLRGSFKDWKKAVRRIERGKWDLDLRALNGLDLLDAGVDKKNMIRMNVCTCCKRDEFHSFRRDRTEERNYAVAALR